MPIHEGKVVDLQAEGQGLCDDSHVVSRRTLIKAAWTVPVIAATITPSSVFAGGCSQGPNDGYNPSGCTQSWGYYKQVQNWAKENYPEGMEFEIAGQSLTKENIIYILNEAPPPNDSFKLYRQLVAAKIGTAYNLSPTGIGTASDGSDIAVVIAKAETELEKSGYLTDDPMPLSSEAKGYSDILEAYVTNVQYHCN